MIARGRKAHRQRQRPEGKKPTQHLQTHMIQIRSICTFLPVFPRLPNPAFLTSFDREDVVCGGVHAPALVSAERARASLGRYCCGCCHRRSVSARLARCGCGGGSTTKSCNTTRFYLTFVWVEVLVHYVREKLFHAETPRHGRFARRCL